MHSEEVVKKLSGKKRFCVFIFLLILGCIYMVSPYDVIPEGMIEGWLGYTDDVLVFVLSCVKSYNMGKGIA